MIKKDQPIIFGSAVVAGVSSVDDGNMKLGVGDDTSVVKNRRHFLDQLGVDSRHTTRVTITYDTDNFAKYRVVTHHDKGNGMHDDDAVDYADALVVDRPNHALFLPIADCVGAILYDPVKRVLMVSHLGRHSVEIDGAAKSVTYLMRQYDCNPADVLVWLSPAVGSATYPLNKFDGKSLHYVIQVQLAAMGILADHVEVSDIDTAHDENYFSHSEFLKDATKPSGRFAVVAMMVAQGEPAA